MACCIQDDPAANKPNKRGQKRGRNSCNICLSAIFLRSGRERITKRGTIESKVLVFFLTFLQAQPAPHPPAPSHPDPLEARPAETCARSEGVKSKMVSQEKAVMAGKDVAAVGVFLLGCLRCSPVFWGCTLSEGAAPGLTGGSGI